MSHWHKASLCLCTRVNTVVLYLVTAVHTHLISGFVQTEHRTVRDQWAYVLTVSVYFLRKVAQKKGDRTLSIKINSLLVSREQY